MHPNNGSWVSPYREFSSRLLASVVSIVVLMAFSASPAFAQAGAPNYVFQDLVTSPIAILGNRVIGYTGGSTGHGYLYDIALGTYQTLPAAPGSNVSIPYGIDGDDVVGFYFPNWPSPPVHGFIYNLVSGSWTTIDYPGVVPGGTTIQAKSGDYIVGSYGNGNGYVSRISTGVFTTIIASTGESVSPYGISGDQVVGNYFLNGVVRGFIYRISTGGLCRSPIPRRSPPAATTGHMRWASKATKS
ncbi:MAG: outer rane autotransporter barrel domain protein [Verrucomicrobia bacterium]|nr:outer rane autotransporter barrel domain protein [Verrucomicrobiota bacterium]